MDAYDEDGEQALGVGSLLKTLSEEHSGPKKRKLNEDTNERYSFVNPRTNQVLIGEVISPDDEEYTKILFAIPE